MAVFAYRSIDESSTLVEGTVSADSARAARDLLRAQGLIVESVTAKRGAQASRRRLYSRRTRHAAKRVSAIRELSTLLAAGIPVLEALDSLVEQHQGQFRESLLLLRENVASGTSLADAMREQDQVYDELSVHMVEVGENSGTLDVVLDQLANFSERYPTAQRPRGECPVLSNCCLSAQRGRGHLLDDGRRAYAA